MRLQLLQKKGAFYFRIKDVEAVLLKSEPVSKKITCLKLLETTLLNLRDKTQTIVERETKGNYHFDLGNKVTSATFPTKEAAKAALKKLKDFVHTKTFFDVTYQKVKKQVVSKKRIGYSENTYRFDQKVSVGKAGFELIDNKTNNHYYFRFNDKAGEILLFSNGFDGKNRRLKAIHAVIKNSKENDRVKIIQQEETYFFVIKTVADYEIARSKSFDSRLAAETALAYVAKETSQYEDTFQLSKKKKKKKRKVTNSYNLKQKAPLGLIGFEAFRDKKDKLHYFHYHDEKGSTLLYSKPYEKRSDRDAAINYLIKNGGKKKYYKTWDKAKKQHYFSVTNKKGKSVVRSCYFDSKEAMQQSMQMIRLKMKQFETPLNIVTAVKKEQIKLTLPPKISEGTKHAEVHIRKEVAPRQRTYIQETEGKVKKVVENPITDEKSPIASIPQVAKGILIETAPAKENVVISDVRPVFSAETNKPKTPLESTERTIASATSKSSNNAVWKGLLWLLLGVFLIALLFKYCGNAATENKVVPKETPVVKPQLETPTTVKEPLPSPVAGPSAQELELKPNTAEARMADFLSNPKLKTPKTFILESVKFPFNSAVLSNSSFEQLNHVVNVLTTYPTAKIEINGHTDNKGNDTRNQTLSENRAKAVSNYLVQNGIAKERIINVVGFGETNPIATNETDRGRQENRRSEIVVVER